MSERIATPTVVIILIPVLLAGALIGAFLKARTADAGPGRTAQPPRVARPPVLDAPRPDSAQVAPPADSVPAPGAVATGPETLGERLKDVHASRMAWHDLQWKPDGDPKTRGQRFKEAQDRLYKSWGELQKSVLKDPEAFVDLLRKRDNEELLNDLLSGLTLGPYRDDVLFEYTGATLLKRAQCPPAILDALRQLLDTGSNLQKKGVIDLIRRGNRHFKDDLFDRDAVVERCTHLTAEGDSRLRASAMSLLQSFDPRGADGRFGVVQELWRASKDAELRLHCLEALRHMQSVEATEFFFARATEMVTDPQVAGDPLLTQKIHFLFGSRTPKLPEDTERYTAFYSTMLRKGPSDQFDTWLSDSMSLPLSDVKQLLEQARTDARTPEQQCAVARVMEQISAGETRRDQLQMALRKRP
jgi:hypothetical protein